MKSVIGRVKASAPVMSFAEDVVVSLAMLERDAKKLRVALGGYQGKNCLVGEHVGENISFELDRFCELTRLATRARASFMALGMLVLEERKRATKKKSRTR